MKRHFKLLNTIVAALLLTAFVACGEGETTRGYGDWDTDSNAMLDENEWGTAWGESGYYDRWDANNDDILDENEWNTGRSSYLTDYDEGVNGGYGDWDLNDDNQLDENEFRGGVWGYYDRDRDGAWSEEEYDGWWGTVGM